MPLSRPGRPRNAACWLCGALGAHHPDGHGLTCCRCFQEEFDHCSNIRSLAIPGPSTTVWQILEDLAANKKAKPPEEIKPENARSEN
jgi:hypothetical protein